MGLSYGWKNKYNAMCQSPWYDSWNSQIECLKLNKSNTKTIFRFFHAIAKHNIIKKEYGIKKLMQHFELDPTVFSERVFCVVENSDDIDFLDFTLSLWNFCTLTNHAMENFVFNLYAAENKNNLLSANQMTIILQEIYGRALENNTTACLLKSDLADQNRRRITFDLSGFRQFVHSHPAFLSPVLFMQSVLRDNILGSNIWGKLTRVRRELTREPYTGVVELVQAEMLERGWLMRDADELPLGSDSNGKAVRRKEFYKISATEPSVSSAASLNGHQVSTDTRGRSRTAHQRAGQGGGGGNRDKKSTLIPGAGDKVEPATPVLNPEELFLQELLSTQERASSLGPRCTSGKRYRAPSRDQGASDGNRCSRNGRTSPAHSRSLSPVRSAPAHPVDDVSMDSAESAHSRGGRSKSKIKSTSPRVRSGSGAAAATPLICVGSSGSLDASAVLKEGRKNEASPRGALKSTPGAVSSRTTRESSSSTTSTATSSSTTSTLIAASSSSSPRGVLQHKSSPAARRSPRRTGSSPISGSTDRLVGSLAQHKGAALNTAFPFDTPSPSPSYKPATSVL